MSVPESAPRSALTRPAAFHTTRWTLVLAAQGHTSPEASRSLESLCTQYWPPLYSFIRQHGHSVHDAQDLTQTFFALLLQKDWLTAVDRQKGRFRTFLLVALKRFLANQRDYSNAQKRGGFLEFVSLDAEIAGPMPIPDPNVICPEVWYDRRWALSLLESVMRRLREEHEHAGRLDDYEILKPSLTSGRGNTDYVTLAARLKLTPASARSAVHRLRKRFREMFRQEVASTVASPADVDDELRYVVNALGSV